MFPHRRVIEWLEDGFFDCRSTRLNRSSSQQLLPSRQETGELLGSKDITKRSNHINDHRRRLDRLDHHRWNHQLSRSKSEHQARSPGTLRDIVRPRSAIRLQGDRRLQDTRIRPDEESVGRMEGYAPVSQRTKTKDPG